VNCSKGASWGDAEGPENTRKLGRGWFFLGGVGCSPPAEASSPVRWEGVGRAMGGRWEGDGVFRVRSSWQTALT